MKKTRSSGLAQRHQAAKQMSRVRAQQQRATQKYEKKKLLLRESPPFFKTQAPILVVPAGVTLENLLRRRGDRLSRQLTLFEDDFVVTENINRTLTKSQAEGEDSAEEHTPGTAEPSDSDLLSEPTEVRPYYVQPPLRAEYLLYLCLPPSERECVPGDLYEEYNEEILPKFGEQRAKWWYWGQVFRSIWPILGRRIARVFTLGAVVRVADALWKRFIS